MILVLYVWMGIISVHMIDHSCTFLNRCVRTCTQFLQRDISCCYWNNDRDGHYFRCVFSCVFGVSIILQNFSYKCHTGTFYISHMQFWCGFRDQRICEKYLDKYYIWLKPKPIIINPKADILNTNSKPMIAQHKK